MDRQRDERDEDSYNMGLVERDVDTDNENETSSDVSEVMNGEPAIGLIQAQSIVEQKFPGKQIVEFGHKTENGQRVYSFSFSDSSRVDVNFSGDITYSKNQLNGN